MPSTRIVANATDTGHDHDQVPGRGLHGSSGRATSRHSGSGWRGPAVATASTANAAPSAVTRTAKLIEAKRGQGSTRKSFAKAPP